MADIETGGGGISVETDPIVGAVTGIVKADGAGNISAAVADTDYSTPAGAAALAAAVGLTLVGSSTVTGAATTTISVTGLSNVRHVVIAKVIHNYAGLVIAYLYLNNVSTGYVRSYQSEGTGSNDTVAVATVGDGIGDAGMILANVVPFNSQVFLHATIADPDRTTPKGNQVVVRSSETSISSFYLTSDRANGLGIGTKLEVYAYAT